MVFFGDQLNLPLSEGIAKAIASPIYYPDIKVFPDGERRVQLKQSVVDEDVIFVKTSTISDSWD